jgi:hypothetical protein
LSSMCWWIPEFVQLEINGWLRVGGVLLLTW